MRKKRAKKMLRKIPSKFRKMVGKKIVVNKKVYYRGPKSWVIEFRTVRYDSKKRKLYYKYKGHRHYIRLSDIKRK